MASSPIEVIVEHVRALAPDQQIEVAEAIDRLTWAQRWRAICSRIEARARHAPTVSDEHIDEAVRAVREEKPLSERSSTLPS